MKNEDKSSYSSLADPVFDAKDMARIRRKKVRAPTKKAARKLSISEFKLGVVCSLLCARNFSQDEVLVVVKEMGLYEGKAFTTFMRWAGRQGKTFYNECKGDLRPSSRFFRLTAADIKQQMVIVEQVHSVLDEFVIGNLPEDVKSLWDSLMFWVDAKQEIPKTTMQTIMESPTPTKQALWLHAWFCTGFKQTNACRMLNIPYRTVEAWKRNDKKFLKLFNYMLTAMKDRVTGAVMSLVDMMEPATVRFAAERLVPETFGRSSVRVEHSGTVEHNHKHTHMIDLATLELPLEIKRQVLEAVEKQQLKKELQDSSLEIESDFMEDRNSMRNPLPLHESQNAPKAPLSLPYGESLLDEDLSRL